MKSSVLSKLKKIRKYLRILKNSDNPNDHAIKYFIILHNFLILEVKFQDEVNMSKKQINKYLDLPEITSEDEILKLFLELYDTYSKVRFAVETFDSIEEIRVYLKNNRDIYNKLLPLKSLRTMKENLDKIIKKTIREATYKQENYMFFSNLKQIKRQCEILLQMDPNMVDEILSNGHDWADDHVTEAKVNLDQVFDFMKNEKDKHESYIDYEQVTENKRKRHR